MTEKNALSRRQFRQSGFDEADYAFNTRPGTFLATIDCKRWGKGKKLVTYMTFADGRKIIAPTWPRSQYEGLANMRVGAKIRILYKLYAPDMLKGIIKGYISDYDEEMVKMYSVNEAFTKLLWPYRP